MDLDLDLAQLRALTAVVDEGSFEGAARRLHVTPSAISQRLKALERACGRVLVVRSRPTRTTTSGAAVLRLARQVELLAADTAAELGGEPDGDGDGGGAFPAVPVAVNADSLGTWVLPALAPLAGDLRLELYREDEARTADLLRTGMVMGAVTADAEAVPGCSVRPLGVMRYIPMATPQFLQRWMPDGPTPAALATAPVVVFDRHDRLQHEYLDRRTARHRAGSNGPRSGAASLNPPQHRVPATADFLTAVRLGFGWGMVSHLQLGPDDTDLVAVDDGPDAAVDVPLHWQQWKLRSPALDRVADAVVTAARTQLRTGTRT